MEYKKLLLALLALFFCAFKEGEQKTNFYEHILPIMQTHCWQCHSEGQVGPFPLITYNDVVEKIHTIRSVTLSHFMPPWKPDRHYSSFLYENYLTDEEQERIGQWIADGLPEGVSPKIPAPQKIANADSLVEYDKEKPDLILCMDKPYLHVGKNKDQYMVFVLPSNLEQDVFVRATRYISDNPKLVHHALVSLDTVGKYRKLDEKTPEYGLSKAIFPKYTFDFYTPGKTYNSYPDAFGVRIPRQSDILISVHYAPTPIDEQECSCIYLFFSREKPKQVVTPIFVGKKHLDEPLEVPANQKVTICGTFTAKEDLDLLRISPHAHYVAHSCTGFALPPNKKDTLPLLKIQDWDFNWQDAYWFKYPLFIAKKTDIKLCFNYDNTINNPRNPNMPPIDIGWGEKTDDEMLFMGLCYVPHREGNNYIPLDPNAQHKVIAEYATTLLNTTSEKGNKLQLALAKDAHIKIDFYGQNGEKISVELPSASYKCGRNTVTLPAILPKGLGFIRIGANGNEDVLFKKIVLI